MIRIDRGHEPASLLAIRDTERARVRGIAHSRQPTGDDIGHAYREVARPLFDGQHGKCCYCEKALECSYNDVDHYRPKARARRGAAFFEHGYWWLAWTWENLLYACPICNRTYKRDAFPLADGSKVLDTDELPPGHERPLLIDPAAEDPLDAIQFRPVRVGRKQEWRPFAKNGRGQITIETLGLDREDLRELYRRHVNDTMRGKLDAFRLDLRSEDAKHIAGCWHRLVRSLLRAGAPFAGLSHDVLDHELGAELRGRWRLSLPRPPLRPALVEAGDSTGPV